MVVKYGAFIKHPQSRRFIYSFVKKLLGVKQSTQNDFIYGELGRLSFASQRYVSIIRYWLKLVSLNENKHAKCVYDMQLEDMRSSPKKKWASSVKQLLSKYVFMDIWISQGVENSSSFLQVFKQRVRDIYKLEWHERLENSSRVRFYVN